MKKYFGFIAIVLIFLTGCTGVKTVTSGLADEAFLEFVGDPSQYDEVLVTVDEDIEFKAEVNKPNANRPKGEVYAISPGSHIVSVSSNGEVVFRKKIYISTQETRKIELP
jgi:hypothetical protein